MANVNTICVPALMEMMNGNHALGTSTASGRSPTKDVYKAALYYAIGTLDQATTVYTATNEVSGAGYTATGLTVPNTVVPTYTGNVAYWTPSGAFVWSTFSATAFDAVMIYNSSQGNKALSIHNFGSQTVSSGTFTLTMPVNADSTALIRFSRVP